MNARNMALNPVEAARQAGERLHHFHGGLRLRHNKKISCELPVARVPLATRLFVPLLQHKGPEAVPAVEPGARVLKGDVIGRPGDGGGACVHAPTSGTVSAIVRHPVTHPSGQEGLCMVIRPDGLDRWGALEPVPDWQAVDPVLIRQKIRNAGVVGLGGAVFPTAFKIESAARNRIHTLILNGAECEPYISCDEMLMREQPDPIVLGARILRHAVGAERVIIAIEDQMGVVNQALRRAVARSGARNVDVVKVTTIYPEGAERQLIQVLTGLEVPSGGVPADLGLLCQNVATAVAVARAVTEGKPLVERIVTVTGNGVRRPRNLLAPFGTPIADLVEMAGGYAADVARLVLGGPMMGYALETDANPVVKASNCVLALTGEDIRAPQPEMPCINCGECVRVCPAMLLPQRLHWATRAGLWDETRDLGLQDCIECGCCDFVCPSHIPLVQWFLFGKAEVRGVQEQQRRAELARRRHESREARLERIAAERHSKREEKKRALGQGRDGKREIAAAVERARERRESKS